MLSEMVSQYIVDDNRVYHNITWSGVEDKKTEFRIREEPRTRKPKPNTPKARTASPSPSMIVGANGWPIANRSPGGRPLRRRRGMMLVYGRQRLRGDRRRSGRFNQCASLTAWYVELLDVFRPSPSCCQIENHTSAYCPVDASRRSRSGHGDGESRQRLARSGLPAHDHGTGFQRCAGSHPYGVTLLPVSASCI
jgi:hypothetical protein